MKALYPLHDFECNAEYPVKIAEGLSVVLNTIDFDSLGSDFLSKYDKSVIDSTPVCLQIDTSVVRPEEASIAFILSCRLLKRTKVLIRYRIDDLRDISIIRDNYPYVTSDDATNWMAENDYQTISKIYDGLLRFKRINTRTGNAVYFISMAYRSWKWIETLIFHVCALETLTSASDRERDITEKFKRRISNFIAYDESNTFTINSNGDDEAKLEEIYNVRSELVHGRYSFETIEKNRSLRLIAEEVCRSVFSKILLSNDCLEAFKNNDTRMRLFEKS